MMRKGWTINERIVSMIETTLAKHLCVGNKITPNIWTLFIEAKKLYMIK